MCVADFNVPSSITESLTEDWVSNKK